MAKTRRPISELRASGYNPRRIRETAMAGLGESLRKFGDVGGIVLNRRTGHLVSGHQRLAALKAAGAKEWHARDGSGGWIEHPKTGARFLVRVVDWDEPTEKAANLAANHPGLQGEFTEDLAAIVGELTTALPDLSSALDFDSLLGEIVPQEVGIVEDTPPEPPKKAVSKAGDLWLLGGHRLLCGDSTKVEDVGRLMGKERAVLMATDPPYGVDYAKTKDGIPRPGFRSQLEDWGNIAGDDLKDAALGEFLTKAFKAASDLALRPTAAWYLWHAHLTAGFFSAAAAAAADVLLHRQIIWRKPHLILTRSGMYHWQHEPCFYGWRRGHKPAWYGSKSQTSVWEIGQERDRVHQTQKPVELFAIPIRNHTRKGEIVYEPFSGSGTQIVAAEQLGRRCYAIEIEGRFCDVGILRWEALTGKKATNEATGREFPA